MDADRNDIIYEELDDTHLLVDPSKVEFIKSELNRLLSENIYNPLEEEENSWRTFFYHITLLSI